MEDLWKIVLCLKVKSQSMCLGVEVTTFRIGNGETIIILITGVLILSLHYETAYADMKC